VPFFFKQFGGVRKAEADREPDGTTYDLPEAAPRELLGAASRPVKLSTSLAGGGWT
jgi:hypothetical protein